MGIGPNDLPPYIFDYVDRALDRITFPLSKENFCNLVKIFAEEVQCAEDSLFALIAERQVSNAVGANLDQWGVIVGQPRDGLEDMPYRQVILTAIERNNSEGTVNELLSILAGVTGSDSVKYEPLYPAGMAFSYVADPPLDDNHRERVKDMITPAVGAGIGLDYIVEAQEGYFGFDDDPDALGFGEGKFAEVI